MIPKDKYIFVEGVGDVITDELFLQYHDNNEHSIFYQWLRCQTYLLMDNGKAGIYSWDYERWIRQGKKTEQGRDWD
ncbi:MAG: hypothetical protein WC516_09005 [Patescibacteria group bacterium]|jgi:hypothetical protein